MAGIFQRGPAIDAHDVSGISYYPLEAAAYAVRSSIDWRGHGWDTTVLIDGNTVPEIHLR